MRLLLLLLALGAGWSAHGQNALRPAVNEADWDYENTREYPPHPTREPGATETYQTPTRTRLAGALHLKGPLQPHATWQTAPTLDPVRHFRIAFTQPVAVGTVIGELGAGRVSYLLPTAAPPGDVTDEAAWAPADEPHPDRPYRAALLPAGTTTRALRVTFRLAEPPAAPVASVLKGLALFAERLHDHAPEARPLVSSYSTKDAVTLEQDGPHRLTDGSLAAWRNAREKARPLTVEEPEWAILAWPQPRRIDGVWLVNVFGKRLAVDVLTRTDLPPALAEPADWSEVATATVPIWWRPEYTDFGLAFAPRETTAVRLRIVEPWLAENSDINYQTGGGENPAVARIGEALALQALGTAPRPTPAAESALPPPLRLTYDLPAARVVSLAIDDATGRRVRHLVAHQARPAGRVTELWDGCDDAGRPVPPGRYRLTGLHREPEEVRYEFSLYWAGQTPWLTPDNRGGWLSDHAAPRSVAALGEQVFLGAHSAESGHTLIAVDLAGRKLWGTKWLDLAGAAVLATDGQKLYVGSEGAWLGHAGLQMTISELDPTTYRWRRLMQRQENPGLAGLAVSEGRLYVAHRERDEIAVFELARLGQQVNEPDTARVASWPVPRPGALALDPARRRLLALSADRLVAVGLADGRVTPVADRLVAPRDLTVAADGTIYVSQRGEADNIVALTPDGRPLRTVGEAGGRQVGPYRPRRLGQPAGLAVDARGRLWVAEEDYQPKRVSLWDPLSDRLLNEWLGGPEYGGGPVWLDPRDKTRATYKGMEFALDWTAGTWNLKRIYYRPGDLARGHIVPLAHAPDRPVYVGQRRFLVYDHMLHTGYVVLAEDTGDVERGVVLRAMLGSGEWATGGNQYARGSALRGSIFDQLVGERDPRQLNFAWSDRNGDGVWQADEVTLAPLAGFGRPDNRLFAYWGALVGGDLTVALMSSGGVWRYEPAGWTECGAPVYRLTEPARLGPLPADTFQSLAILPSGEQVVLANPILGLAADGTVRWTYPHPWPGVHGSHRAPSAQAGRVIGGSRVIGTAVLPRLGEVFCANGNKGELYVFTADGLLVATLFRDHRVAGSWAGWPTPERGRLADNLTLQEECFGPSFTQTTDGKLYVIAGHHHASLCEITGLETAERFAADYELTPRDRAVADDYLREVARRAVAAEPRQLTIPRVATPPIIDGREQDWPTGWTELRTEGRPRGAVALAWDDRALYLVARVTDATPLINRADDLKLLFKGGDAVDLFLGLGRRPDRHPRELLPGDLRIILAQVEGRPRAVVYRYVVPGAPPVAREVFASPVRSVTIDQVEELAGATIVARVAGNGYLIEAALPWAALGPRPEPGAKLPLDPGFIFSTPDGDGVAERVYWANPTGSIVSDIPTEALAEPTLWGWATFAP